MAFRWWANDGPKLNAGLVALSFSKRPGPVLLRNPIAFVIFRGGGGGGGGGRTPLDRGPCDDSADHSVVSSTANYLFKLCAKFRSNDRVNKEPETGLES